MGHSDILNLRICKSLVTLLQRKLGWEGVVGGGKGKKKATWHPPELEFVFE